MERLGKSRGSSRAVPKGAWRDKEHQDLAESSIQLRPEVPGGARGLAGIVALSVLSRMPNAKDLDYLSVVVHLVNHDVGWHGGQLAPVRYSWSGEQGNGKPR